MLETDSTNCAINLTSEMLKALNISGQQGEFHCFPCCIYIYIYVSFPNLSIALVTLSFVIFFTKLLTP